MAEGSDCDRRRSCLDGLIERAGIGSPQHFTGAAQVQVSAYQARAEVNGSGEIGGGGFYLIAVGVNDTAQVVEAAVGRAEFESSFDIRFLATSNLPAYRDFALDSQDCRVWEWEPRIVQSSAAKGPPMAVLRLHYYSETAQNGLDVSRAVPRAKVPLPVSRRTFAPLRLLS